MKITDALRIVQQADAGAPPYRLVLACGFTPLHMQTFLAAHLQQRLPHRKVAIATGLYGNLVGTLYSLRSPGEAQAVAVALEWADLDPRLGYRGEGQWKPSSIGDVLEAAGVMLGRLATAIEALPGGIPTAVSLPTLLPAPVFHTPGARLAEAELQLERALLDFADRLSRRDGCAMVNRGRLAEESEPAGRYDLKSDLLNGLPYSVAHADALAVALASLVAPAPPKKGLITDLDDTLWSGIVGEIGADKVCWDLASHCQLHGLYQQLLGSLAEEGVLIAIASKNDPAVVKQALERSDLRLRPDQIFPVEVSWNAKSAAVEHILRVWNVGADSVVFVDDSAMELAEVAGVHHGIECIRFPKGDYRAAHTMLQRLRDLFGKPRIAAEDSIRLESIRQGAVFQEAAAAGEASEQFLEQAGAEVAFDWRAEEDPRVLELVNKTNQFNLNGVRCLAAEWKARLSQPGAWLTAVSYADRFGPLGKIAILQGRRLSSSALEVDTWVMSCRAFSRRIEHQCLRVLFDRYPVEEIVFDLKATPKNGPLRDFCKGLTGAEATEKLILTRATFEANCPRLYHRVTEASLSLAEPGSGS